MVLLSAGGRILVLGGLLPSGSSSAAVWSLDPAAGRVQAAGSLLTPTHDAAGAIIGGQALIFGGGAATSTDSVQSFQLPSGPASPAGRLPAPRSDLGAAVAAGRTVVLGGYDGQTGSRPVLATDDGRVFTTVAELVMPVRYPAVAALGPEVLVAGGMAAGRATDLVQGVDPGRGSAEIIGKLPFPLQGAAAFALAGQLWIAGGTSPTGISDAVLRYDPARPAEGFVTAGRLPFGVTNAGVVTDGDRAYLAGGETAAGFTDTIIELSGA